LMTGGATCTMVSTWVEGMIKVDGIVS